MTSSASLNDVKHTSSWMLAIIVGVEFYFIQNRWSKLSLLKGFSKFNFDFPYSTWPKSQSRVGISIIPTTFLWLGTKFLDCFLKLVLFLAQLGERLLCRIGFLSAFLGGMRIGFLRSVFLILMTIFCVVRSMRAHASCRGRNASRRKLSLRLLPWTQYQVYCFLSCSCWKPSWWMVSWIFPAYISAL